jgi:hypothetical protein
MGKAVIPFKRPRLIKEKEDESSQKDESSKKGRVQQKERVIQEGQEGDEL